MNSKIALGDPHNFNRRVALFSKDGESFIEKPRCIYWEYLFLDKTSPFRAFLRNLDAHVNFDEILGSLEITTTDDFKTGLSKKINESAITDSQKWLTSFGEILAFTSVFGITDLHRENVLNVDNRPRLVDIECLFWDLEIPSETFLLPKGDFEWSKSIWTSTEFKGLRTFSPVQVLLVLNGYHRTIEYFLLHAEAVQEFFNGLPFYSHPVRLLIERTRDYRTALDQGLNLEAQFLPDEVTQLRRGDIPYFFGYTGEKNIHFYSSETETASVSKFNEKLESKRARSFKTPQAQLGKSRLSRLAKQGVVEIIARLLDMSSVPFESSELVLQMEESFLKIKYGSLHLQVRQQNNG